MADFYYDRNRGCYWAADGSDHCWYRLNDTQMARKLNCRGLSRYRNGGRQASAVDREMERISVEQSVDLAGPLAGYRMGVYTSQGQRMLVTRSPLIIEPQPGDCSIIHQTLKGLVGEKQLPFLFSWLATSNRCLRQGFRRPAPALVLAGPQDCGKTFVLKKIISPLLGGRMAAPYQYMSGKTPFNADLFEAELLYVDDELGSTDIRSRRAFGVSLKQVAASTTHRLHRKGVDALVADPFWRLVICCNSEAEHLMVLPPLDDSIRDKMVILHCGRFEFPMSCRTNNERNAYDQQITNELPAFTAFLDAYETPQEALSTRYEMRSFVADEVDEELHNLSPENRLQQLIDEFLVFPGHRPVELTSRQLEQQLRDAEGCKDELRQIANYFNSIGTYLGRLAKRPGARVDCLAKLKSGGRMWKLTPPPDQNPQPEKGTNGTALEEALAEAEAPGAF